MELLDGPRVAHRPETPTLGIRVVTPFRGMLAVRDRLLAELGAWLAERGIETDGPFFLRLHVVDMTADMDIEVGVLDIEDAGDDRVRPSSAPAGDYALLAYAPARCRPTVSCSHGSTSRGSPSMWIRDRTAITGPGGSRSSAPTTASNRARHDGSPSSPS